MNTAATQSAKICRALLRGKSITPLSALRDFGCFRLGARIFDLRRAGLNISREWVKRNGKRFARYRLA